MIDGFKAPTSDWNVTGTFGHHSLFATHYYGVKAKG